MGYAVLLARSPQPTSALTGVRSTLTGSGDRNSLSCLVIECMTYHALLHKLT